MQLAAEFKAGEQLLMLNDVNLDWNWNVWVLGRKQHMCNHRHSLDGPGKLLVLNQVLQCNFMSFLHKAVRVFLQHTSPHKNKEWEGGGKTVNAFCVWNEWEVMKTMRKLKWGFQSGVLATALKFWVHINAVHKIPFNFLDFLGVKLWNKVHRLSKYQKTSIKRTVKNINSSYLF